MSDPRQFECETWAYRCTTCGHTRAAHGPERGPCSAGECTCERFYRPDDEHERNVLDAFRVVVQALQPLDNDQRRRVARAAFELLGPSLELDDDDDEDFNPV